MVTIIGTRLCADPLQREDLHLTQAGTTPNFEESTVDRKVEAMVSGMSESSCVTLKEGGARGPGSSGGPEMSRAARASRQR